MSEVDILRVQNLQKFFPVKDSILRKTDRFIRAVDDISFSIKAGETLGLVGESGSGKSTVARLIMQLIKLDKGEVFFQGVNLAQLSRKGMVSQRRGMQMVFQDPLDSLNPRFTVEEILLEPLLIHKIGNQEQKKKRVLELLELTGLNREYLLKYPHEFSGGQRQRLGIARALALSPQLIVADEAVSALDISVQAQILNLFQDLQNELGISYLFISHDLNVIRHVSDRIVVMYLGKMVENAPAENFSELALHPYTQALIDAIPSVSETKKEKEELKGEIPGALSVPSGCVFHTRCSLAREHCERVMPLLEKAPKNESHLVACHERMN